MARYTLHAWTKPGSTETRIYVGGGKVNHGDKLYIFAAHDTLLGREGWDARLQTQSGIGYVNRGLGSRQYDIGLAIAEEALAERGLDRKGFSEILAALN